MMLLVNPNGGAINARTPADFIAAVMSGARPVGPRGLAAAQYVMDRASTPRGPVTLRRFSWEG